MSTGPKPLPHPTTSASLGTPGTPSSAGADHVPPTPSPHPTPGPSHATRRHPAVLAVLVAGALVLVGVLVMGVVRGSTDMISTGVIGLLVMTSWVVTPWAVAHAATRTTGSRQASTLPSGSQQADPKSLGSLNAGPQHTTSQDPDPQSPQDMDPQQAADLLRQADRLGAATASGAGTPYALSLLGLGTLSSMLTVALYLVAFTDERLILLPLTVSMVWLAILIAAMAMTARATRLGFARRWSTSMASFSTVWVLTVLGSTTIWRGELWFTVLAVAALTAVTVWGARRAAS